MTTFKTLPLKPEILAVTEELGYEKMTPIQARSIPSLLAGKDLVGQSKTGSGKTAAFAVPLLQKIDVETRDLQALILCPTRELCAQVAREVRRLGRRLSALQVLVVSGGQPIGPQREALERGVHIVVGTPGRLVDLIHKGRFDARTVRTLILDEADRMLDMGFEDDMRVIMSEMPAQRQTIFFSATYPDTIQALSGNFQKNPVRVIVEETEEKPNVEQIYFDVENEEKENLLKILLRKRDPDAALIFCNLKASIASLAQSLARDRFSVSVIHGDLEQRDRDEVLAKFRNGSIRFLIATDVAARGLDIASLPMVINYDLPHEVESFVHRTGRTGRAGQNGVAISLVAAHDKMKLLTIQREAGIVFEVGSLGPRGGTPQWPRPAEMRTVFVGAGRKDKLRPGDLLGALTKDAGFEAADVGKIEIHDRFSYVAVAEEIAESAVRKLTETRIKNLRLHIKLLP